MYLNEADFSHFLEEKEVTWLGIDFSKATFTKKGFDFPQEVVQHYFTVWNSLIISDPKRYDIRLSFRKPVMYYDLSLVTKKNKSVKLARLLSSVISFSHTYQEEAIVEYVKTLEIPQETRYAVMIIVESFDDITKLAALWVVIVNTETQNAVLCEKFLKSPGGFGTKNYWIRAFYNLFFDVQKQTFTRWKNLVNIN